MCWPDLVAGHHSDKPSPVGIGVIFSATALKLMLRMPRKFGMTVSAFVIDKVCQITGEIPATVK